MSLQKYFGQNISAVVGLDSCVFFSFFLVYFTFMLQATVINKLTWLKCLFFQTTTPKNFKIVPVILLIVLQFSAFSANQYGDATYTIA